MLQLEECGWNASKRLGWNLSSKIWKSTWKIIQACFLIYYDPYQMITQNENLRFQHFWYGMCCSVFDVAVPMRKL